ncbi:transposase [Desulfopila aestuarii]|uniref:Transposase DDE domain group 1 n=1 Tax=Desulfopila aestuarii DSM 18488 TaxID=1121416 RepID=A0A1M7YI67_9BACT|nr:transposase [Desulfopila aestuarii]SHO52315.1 Transposase DDE domain group 1 [Desulfopila aestuarii DSM 18488]
MAVTSIAYVLSENLRRCCLQGIEYARSQVSTIRLKILKVAVVVIRNTRRIKILLGSSYSFQGLLAAVAGQLAPG